MKRLTLAIVIPTFNEEDYLPSLLASLKEQTFQPEQLIVADAASTDRTREIARQYGATIVEGGRPGAGRNAGARAAATDLIFFLDADVIFPRPDTLERCIKAFERMRLDLATISVAPYDGNAFDALVFRFYNQYVRATVGVHPHAIGAAMLVRRSLHEAIKGFDETVIFAEDMDYAARAARKGTFGMLPRTCQVTTSMRRMERDGRMTTIAKCLAGEAHLVFLGPIRHDGFRYTFGHKKKK